MCNGLIGTLTTLLLVLARVAGEWRPEVLKSTVPCEEMVSFPCVGGCGASDCQAGGQSCWTDYFIQCLCIPDVPLRELRAGSGDDAAVDGVAVCIWSILAKGGEPECCTSYGRRGYSASEGDTQDDIMASEQKIRVRGKTSRDGILSAEEELLSQAALDEDLTINDRNAYQLTDNNYRHTDLTDRTGDFSEKTESSDSKAVKQAPGKTYRQITASLLMRAVCGYLAETGTNLPQCA